MSSPGTTAVVQKAATTRVVEEKKEAEEDRSWYCHCCSYKNTSEVENCKVCSRHESYALEGYPLPLHGRGGAIYRPSQILNVLTRVDETDDEGFSPLHNACVTGNTEAALKLIELNAFIEATTEKGQTPLHLAVYAGSRRTVKALLSKGANSNAPTRYELCTPLHMSCEGGWRDITNDLLAAGANPNARNLLERTPLHLAALVGRADIGASLIREGADITILDSHGWNARQLAELRSHQDFVELVVRAGLQDKMAVLKEFPRAAWHGTLWDEVVHATQKTHNKEKAEALKLAKFQEEVRVARARLQSIADVEKEVMRQQVLKERREAKEKRLADAEAARQALRGAEASDDAASKSTSSSTDRRNCSAPPKAAPPASLLGLNAKEMNDLQKAVAIRQQQKKK